MTETWHYVVAFLFLAALGGFGTYGALKDGMGLIAWFLSIIALAAFILAILSLIGVLET